MIGHGRGGGGGGFGGFPYRSAHQQGQDGRNGRGRGGGRGGRGRGRGRRRRRQQQQRNNNNINFFQAELQIPLEQRGILVGRRGLTLKWIRETTGAKIFVPPRSCVQQPQHELQRDALQMQELQETSSTEYNDISRQAQGHPVRVNTTELPNLLSAFHEISSLLSKGSNNDLGDASASSASSIPCIVKMRTMQNNKNQNMPPASEIKVDGLLLFPQNQNNNGNSTNHQQQSLLFQGAIVSTPNTTTFDTTSSSQPPQLCAYSIATSLSEEDIATLVDNVRFVDSSVDSCQWFYRMVRTRVNGDGNVLTENNSDGDNNDERDATRCLVFVFGSENCNPLSICQAIEEAST
ncbi:hypothetical protein ACHAXR_012230 [Thalassiosira sp. AJA248-18]